MSKKLLALGLHKYRIKVKHDNGHAYFIVIARNVEEAKKQVILAENCPESAIKKLTEI